VSEGIAKFYSVIFCPIFITLKKREKKTKKTNKKNREKDVKKIEQKISD